MYRRFVIVAGAFALLACSESVTPVSDIALAVNVDKSSIRAGESVLISVSVTNQRNEDLIITKLGCNGTAPGFSVSNSSGEYVVEPPTDIPGTCEYTITARIAPGQTYSTTQSWSGERRSSSFAAGPAVSPGRYEVRQVFVIQGRVVAASSPVTITVTP